MHPKPKRKSGVYIVSLDNIGNEHGMQNYLYSGWKINSYTNKKSQSDLCNREIQSAIYKKERDFLSSKANASAHTK